MRKSEYLPLSSYLKADSICGASFYTPICIYCAVSSMSCIYRPISTCWVVSPMSCIYRPITTPWCCHRCYTFIDQSTLGVVTNIMQFIYTSQNMSWYLFQTGWIWEHWPIKIKKNWLEEDSTTWPAVSHVSHYAGKAAPTQETVK